MDRLMTWIAFLTKRLYKRPVFLALLVLIPLLVLGYNMVARQDSGVVTIALACEDPQDALADKLMETLMEQTRIIRYIRVDSAEEAERLVLSERADGAWIFPADLQTRIENYAADRTANGFIRVAEGKPSTALTLAREKLSGAIFHCTSQAFYLHYLSENAPELSNVSEEQLLKYYEGITASGQLFTFTTLDDQQPPETITYLTAPLRGLLGAVAMLAALAAALYACADREKGTFAWLPERHKGYLELGSQLICTTHILLAVTIALGAAGLCGSAYREVALFVLYAVGCAVFGAWFQLLCPGRRLLAALLPAISVLMLVVCPVFFSLDVFRPIRYLLPLTYYILGAYDAKYLLYLAVYDILLTGLYILCRKGFLRKKA